MWPDEANRDTRALRLAAQSGLLELCGKRRDGYRWESVSVTVRQLRSDESAPSNRAIDPQDPSGLDDATPPAANNDASEISAFANASAHQRGFFQAIRRVLGIRHSPARDGGDVR